MRDKVGEEALLTRARAVFAPHRKAWQDWLRGEKRTEAERWLQQALTDAP